MSSLTSAALADFAVGLKLDAIGPRTREFAKHAMLDAIGCAVAAGEERVTRALRSLALDRGSAGPATLWGRSERVRPGDAALINGSAAHALDFDDVSWAMNGHPTVPVLPAAFSLAEVCGSSGADLLVAYVAGFEVQARLGQAMGRGHYEKGWHPTSTLGVFGAAAAAARILELDSATLQAAFGIAASRASGSRMNFGTDTKPLHAGLAARAGLEAAEFARRGITSNLAGIESEMGLADLYHGDRALELTPLGEPFALEDPGLELKPYPSCRFTHRAIDAVLELRKRNPGEDPKRITCATDPFARKILIHPEPRTGLEAKFSLPYCVAVSWLDGWPELGSFADSRVETEEVQDLLREVTVEDAKGADESVEIVFHSGRSDREAISHARGSPARPLSDEERLRKFRSCVSLPLGGEGCDALAYALANLEDVDEVAELGRLCSPA